MPPGRGVAEAVEFDCAAAERNIGAVRPGLRVVRASAKSGAGMEAWLGLVERGYASLRCAG